MAVREGAKAKESNMQFVVSKQNLQRELGFVQGIVERKNTIPVLSNILIEAIADTTVRITGTDLEATIRCDMAAEDIPMRGKICGNLFLLLERSR
jgi:DNA polymerase-3 subunit beta